MILFVVMVGPTIIITYILYESYLIDVSGLANRLKKTRSTVSFGRFPVRQVSPDNSSTRAVDHVSQIQHSNPFSGLYLRGGICSDNRINVGRLNWTVVNLEYNRGIRKGFNLHVVDIENVDRPTEHGSTTQISKKLQQ